MIDKTKTVYYNEINNLRISRKFGGVEHLKYKTEQRKILQNFLANHPHEIFTAKEICEIIDNETVSVSAVYRNLSELEKAGLLRRLSVSGSRKAAYQYIGAASCKEQIHLTCKKCGKTVHMENDDTEVIISRALRHRNFIIDRAGTVLYGICEACQKA